jgi:uncharacterized membrane protein
MDYGELEINTTCLEKIITSYLARIGIPIAKAYCEKQIASHPDYPSILAVADTLQVLGISHSVLRANKEQTGDIPFPALLHLDVAGGSLLPVYNEQDFLSAGEKLNHWSGVLINAEPTSEIVDKQHTKALAEEKRFKVLAALFLTAVAGLVAIPLLFSFSWIQLMMIILSITGAVTGYFLFAKDLGITYRAIESFCNAGTGAGCGKVLRSEEGKLFGFITFPDLTLGYFAAQLIVISLLVPLWADSTLLAVLVWFSFLAFPMVGYSIWLQAFKIKEWCRLCLVISGILTLQALFFGYLYSTGYINLIAVTIPALAITLLLFGVAGSSLLLLKQNMEQKNHALQNEIAAARLKNSPAVFTSLLFKQRQVDTTPFEHDFLIGKPDAPIKLTMAVNLFCGPCKNELDNAKELLRIYPDLVNLSLRFLKSGDGGNSSSLLLNAWLHKLKERTNGMPNGQLLIDKWYETMNVEMFLESHPINKTVLDTEIEEYLKTHYSWITQAGITQTPTTLMNGYELPSAYRIKDLATQIPGLTALLNDINLLKNRILK